MWVILCRPVLHDLVSEVVTIDDDIIAAMKL
jgi:hypothetical protein